MPEGGCHGKEEWITGEVSDCCPVMYVADQTIVFQAYIWAKRGFLPTDWLKQPADLMDGINAIWAAVEVEEARQDRAQHQ